MSRKRYEAEALVANLLPVNSRELEIHGKIVKFLHIMVKAQTVVALARTESVTVQIERARHKL